MRQNYLRAIEYVDSEGLEIQEGIYIKGKDVLSVRFVTVDDKRKNWIYKRSNYTRKLSPRGFKKYRRLSLKDAKKLQRKIGDIDKLISLSLEQLADKELSTIF